MGTAIVAGVGPGLGASLARGFAHEGFAVALLSRTPASSERVAAEIRAFTGKALVLPTDVTQRDVVNQAIPRSGPN